MGYITHTCNNITLQDTSIVGSYDYSFHLDSKIHKGNHYGHKGQTFYQASQDSSTGTLTLNISFALSPRHTNTSEDRKKQQMGELMDCRKLSASGAMKQTLRLATSIFQKVATARYGDTTFHRAYTS